MDILPIPPSTVDGNGKVIERIIDSGMMKYVVAACEDPSGKPYLVATALPAERHMLDTRIAKLGKPIPSSAPTVEPGVFQGEHFDRASHPTLNREDSRRCVFLVSRDTIEQYTQPLPGRMAANAYKAKLQEFNLEAIEAVYSRVGSRTYIQEALSSKCPLLSGSAAKELEKQLYHAEFSVEEGVFKAFIAGLRRRTLELPESALEFVCNNLEHDQSTIFLQDLLFFRDLELSSSDRGAAYSRYSVENREGIFGCKTGYVYRLLRLPYPNFEIAHPETREAIPLIDAKRNNHPSPTYPPIFIIRTVDSILFNQKSEMLASRLKDLRMFRGDMPILNDKINFPAISYLQSTPLLFEKIVPRSFRSGDPLRPLMRADSPWFKVAVKDPSAPSSLAMDPGLREVYDTYYDLLENTLDYGATPRVKKRALSTVRELLDKYLSIDPYYQERSSDMLKFMV